MISADANALPPSLLLPFSGSLAVEKKSPPLPSEWETRELTRLLARGDEPAFREFHRRYFERLFRFLLAVARGNEDEAAEALQQTMLRVVKYARAFESDEEFWSWLKAVARSAARDGGRKRSRYESLLRSFAALLGKNEPEPADDPLWSLLDESLAELPGNDRRLVEAKYLHGKRVRELAAESGLTEKAAESRLGRIRADLRSRILGKLNHP